MSFFYTNDIPEIRCKQLVQEEYRIFSQLKTNSIYDWNSNTEPSMEIRDKIKKIVLQ